MPARVVAVVGPTATGKSDLAVALATAVGGEVVNADSMQLYRGMDIGTAKPTAAEQKGIAHHLLDVCDVTETASVAIYQKLALRRLDELLSAGVPPILVGGSGLYVRAALDRLELPGTDPAIRARLQAELDRTGPVALHDRLAERDPAAANAILASNGRRIVRALEVIELTGRPFSANLPDYDAVHDTTQIGLDLANAALDERIERRVQRMFDAGLVGEVRRLEAAGLRRGRTACRALGYQQVLAMLDGAGDEESARAATVTATRRFARRQRSWFRRDPRIRWLDAAAPDLVRQALAVLSKM
jgi:tRNA dimethylallyltransferase